MLLKVCWKRFQPFSSFLTRDLVSIYHEVITEKVQLKKKAKQFFFQNRSTFNAPVLHHMPAAVVQETHASTTFPQDSIKKKVSAHFKNQLLQYCAKVIQRIMIQYCAFFFQYIVHFINTSEQYIDKASKLSAISCLNDKLFQEYTVLAIYDRACST